MKKKHKYISGTRVSVRVMLMLMIFVRSGCLFTATNYKMVACVQRIVRGDIRKSVEEIPVSYTHLDVYKRQL